MNAVRKAKRRPDAGRPVDYLPGMAGGVPIGVRVLLVEFA